MGIQRLRDSRLENLRQYKNKKSATGLISDLNLLKTENFEFSFLTTKTPVSECLLDSRVISMKISVFGLFFDQKSQMQRVEF